MDSNRVMDNNQLMVSSKVMDNSRMANQVFVHFICNLNPFDLVIEVIRFLKKIGPFSGL